MKTDPLDFFRDMTPDEQRDHILSVVELCTSAAPVSLARKIAIYLSDGTCPYDCGQCDPDDDE